MAEKRWITGEEILERWQAAPFEFVEVVLSKGLTAVDLGTGKRFEWKENDRRTSKNTLAHCFFCTKLGDNPVCYNTFWEDPYSDEDVLCSSVDWEMADGGRDYWRIDFVKQLCFNISEVQAYEQAHGLGPLPHKPETAEALAETLRAAGITDAEMIARMVKAAEIEAHGMKPATTPHTPPAGPGREFQVEEIDPKDFAERELAQGKAPGQVMLALVELYDDMPKWKAAGLVLRRPVVGLNEFERDNLKSRFYDRTRKFRE